MRGSKQRSRFTPSFHRVNLYSPYSSVPRELYGVILAAIIARNPRLIAITVSRTLIGKKLPTDFEGFASNDDRPRRSSNERKYRFTIKKKKKYSIS